MKQTIEHRPVSATLQTSAPLVELRTQSTARPLGWFEHLVDGKQRFTTFVRWLRSELTVPASWFSASEIRRPEDGDDGLYVRLSGLVVSQGRRFRDTPVSVVEATVRTLGEERTIFDLINFGGVAQGETD